MAKEDEEFRAYLEANSYEVSQICRRSQATTVVDDVASDKEEGLRLKSPFLPPPGFALTWDTNYGTSA